jgi:MFS family permease
MSTTVASHVDGASLRPIHWTVLGIAAFGLLFDGYDFQATAYAAPLIRTEWHLEPRVLGGLISAGFFGLFFGSLGASYLADLIGRKTAFALCTFVYSVFTAAASLAPDFNWFLGFRFLTGLGLGGLVPIAVAWLTEFLPPRRRAALTAATLSFFLIGWIVASGAALAVIPSYGWRAFFIIGALPAPLAVALVFWGPESPMWLMSRGRREAAAAILRRLDPARDLSDLPRPPQESPANWLSLFSAQRRLSSIIIACLFFFIATVSAGVTQWLPTLLVDRGIALQSTYLYSLVVSIGPILGTIVMGALLDVLGRRQSFILFWSAASIFTALFAFAPSATGVMLLGFALMFCVVGTFSCLDVITAEIYPTGMRASAVGWGLACSRLGGAFGPILGGYLVSAKISYTGFFLVFAVPPLINIALCLRLKFAKPQAQLS